MTIRYGLIGSGMMGQEHIRNLNLLDGTQVTCVADPDPAMRQRTTSVQCLEVLDKVRECGLSVLVGEATELSARTGKAVDMGG